MARNERWRGLGRIALRQEDSSDQYGAIAALARRLRRMFARNTEKPLDCHSLDEAACGLKSTTRENAPMKDHNGNNAFVHIDGVTYISSAHLCDSVVSFERRADKGIVEGKTPDSRWSMTSKGEFLFESWNPMAPFFTFSHNLPRARAYLSKPEDTEETVILKSIKAAIDSTDLGKSLKSIIEESVKRTMGDVKLATTINNTTVQAPMSAPAVKSLDDLADEFLAPYVKEGTVTDAVMREAYRLANLRIALRSQSEPAPDYIESDGFALGEGGWRLHKDGSVTIHDGRGNETAKIKPSRFGLVIPLTAGFVIKVVDGAFELRDHHNTVRARSVGN